MEIINEILQDSNLQRAIKSVKANKGAPGIDGMTVYQLEEYFTTTIHSANSAMDSARTEVLIWQWKKCLSTSMTDANG